MEKQTVKTTEKSKPYWSDERLEFPDINDPKKPVKLTAVSVGDFFTIDGIFVCYCVSKLDSVLIYYDNNDGSEKTATYTHSDRTGTIWPRWCELYYNQDESLTT